MRFHSGGQAPIVFYNASAGACTHHKPTSFPLAAMPLTTLRPAVTVQMQPGDILVLLSDGIYEYCNAANEEFGERRVEEIVRAHHAKPVAELSAILLGSVQAFAGNAMRGRHDRGLLKRKDAAGPAALQAQPRIPRFQLRLTAEIFAHHQSTPASARVPSLEELSPIWSNTPDGESRYADLTRVPGALN